MIFFFTLTYQIPLFYNVKGILYREIFGIAVVREIETSSTTDNEQKNVEEKIQSSAQTSTEEQQSKPFTANSSSSSKETKKTVDKTDNDDIFTA
jgi:uncharacterized membrane protein YdbT with pleckstrin-like domain